MYEISHKYKQYYLNSTGIAPCGSCLLVLPIVFLIARLHDCMLCPPKRSEGGIARPEERIDKGELRTFSL